MMRRNTLIAAIFLGAFCLAAPWVSGDDRTRLKSERFDRDPGWDGANHRTPNKGPAHVVEDFGYSPTNHARGKAAGEIGGKVVRSSRSAYYLKPLEKAASLDDPLRCSGRFVVTQTGGTSTFYLGWFNSQTIGNGTYPTESLRILNAKAEPGGTLAIYLDDLAHDGEPLSFDADPHWQGLNNRAAFDDDLKRGEHDFGYSPDTQFAGGKPGEIGGLLYSDNGGCYGDDVGRLTLDQPLVASGRLALTERGSEAGLYLGWFNSRERGHPPKNFLGAFVEGPNSVGSMFRPAYASSDPKLGDKRKEGPAVESSGKPYRWRIEYDPQAAGGAGELKATLGDETVVLPLSPEARRQNALFDRFGLAVYEGGGQWSRIYLDDLEYTVGSGK